MQASWTAVNGAGWPKVFKRNYFVDKLFILLNLAEREGFDAGQLDRRKRRRLAEGSSTETATGFKKEIRSAVHGEATTPNVRTLGSTFSISFPRY